VFLLLMTLMGIVGLLICSIPIGLFGYWVFPDWRAYLLAALIATAWCGLRWRVIRNNVRKYHIKKSRNKALTWIWFFLAVGIAAPARKRKATASRASSGSGDDGGFSFSFSGDSSDGGSNGDSGGSDDGGGASGGAGASGKW
jgi:uncharacterized membrane protein YgcG